MLKLTTPVQTARAKKGISYNDKIMMLGSCFADNIGRQLDNYGFNICVNPFGTLYNPISLKNSISRLVSKEKFTASDIVRMGSGSDMLCSFSHHTSFARKDAATFLDNANSSLEEAADFYEKCNKVIITLGTAWCFRLKENGNIVSNCLKRKASEFERIRLSINEIIEALEAMLQESFNTPTAKDFIFTVSPIRHLADGAYGNQLSKSSLLLGIESLLSSESADYFPSYEIMMDELRDYRFYAEDMVHPSLQAENYIRERFCDWALPESEKPVLEANIKKYGQSLHRRLL